MSRVRRIRQLRPGAWILHDASSMWRLVGAAPKGYLAFGDPDDPSSTCYIAKAPRKCGSRECITEEIISQIGRMLPVKVAASRLVRLPGPHGRYDDVRFMSENFLIQGREALVHGIELMARFLEVSGDELSDAFNLKDSQAERRFYSVDDIVFVLKRMARSIPERCNLLSGLGRMIGFDALLGAMDRHAMNWGIVEVPLEPHATWRFSPLFDTARGLFWQQEDEQLEAEVRKGAADYVKRYAEKSRPVFSCQGRQQGANVNHFDLVSYCLEKFEDDMGSPIRMVIGGFSARRVSTMLKTRFGRVISPVRRQLIVDLLQYRFSRLKLITGAR